MKKGLSQVRGTIADARRTHSVGRFLIANMVYQDALVALFAFGGIYGAGVFGWRATELGIFGIMLTVTGTFGAPIGAIVLAGLVVAVLYFVAFMYAGYRTFGARQRMVRSR